MSLRKQNICQSCLILLGWFCIMYIANAWMPLYRDDYLAGVIWKTGDHLQSMGDVFYSLERYYMMHGGRLVSFFVQFVFMLIGKSWFNIANALVFTAMLAVMAMHCRRSLDFTAEPKLLVILGAFSWLGISHFGEIAIWLCGSAVYLWTGLLTALFLLPYNLALAGTLPRRIPTLTGCMLPFGIVASCSVENLTVTTTLLACGICWVAYEKKIFSAWMATGAVGALIGSIICLAAPGNYVRIVDDQDRSWLFHFLNQIPSNLEMIMYMIPILLTLVLAFRILFLASAKRRGVLPLPPAQHSGRHPILLFVLAFSTVSFFTTGFFAEALRQLVVHLVLTPLGLTDEVTLSHFANTMAGFEEALIYILGIGYIYLMSVHALGLEKKRFKSFKGAVSPRHVWKDFPQLRYGVFFIALAFLNNFIVIGAPSFPGRALFSSSIMFIIGAVAILRIPTVQEMLFQRTAGKIFRWGGFCVTGFIILATLSVLHSIWQEDAVRVGYIAREAAAGQQIVTVPPSAIPESRRILRHIAYDDFDTGMTRDHICAYFGISDIRLDPRKTLDDLRE